MPQVTQKCRLRLPREIDCGFQITQMYFHSSLRIQHPIPSILINYYGCVHPLLVFFYSDFNILGSHSEKINQRKFSLPKFQQSTDFMLGNYIPLV